MLYFRVESQPRNHGFVLGFNRVIFGPNELASRDLSVL
jgi:hypothetical protein